MHSHFAEACFCISRELQVRQLGIGEPGSNAALQLCVNYGFPFIFICRSAAKRQLGLAAA